MADDKIYIVGIGDDGLDGLTRQARDRIEQAAVLVGPAGLLRLVPPTQQKRIAIGGDPEQIAETLRTHQGSGPLVLLAGGDPLFYGTARYLCDALGTERFDVVPHVSSMQLAFARVKESWDDAYLGNLATQPLDRVVERIRIADRVGLFTTEELTPAVVARALLERRIDYFTVYVCENLGSRDERVTRGELPDIAQQDFAPLNVLILVRQQGAADRPRQMESRRLFGNPDDAFLQAKPKRGLLTPAEVRCIALAELDLGPSSVVWDVGAGTGSLAIEAAQLASRGRVYAIEMDAEDYGLMLDNARAFGCPTLTPVHGRAPEAFADLPDPDAVFVGGTGRDVARLCASALQRLKPRGRLVANVSGPENLVAVQAAIGEMGWEAEMMLISIARGNLQMERTRFEGLNPTFLIMTRRP
jgi:precorrin-6Y C5,15-methyltransferase (decarboxylating)